MITTTEKQGFLRKIKNLPYFVMNKYIYSHDNTDSFQNMYSGMWFIALIAMTILTVICFKVDYHVLYGIEYTATLDHKLSHYSALKSATIIQFLILVCGGVFFKTIVFGKLLSGEKTRIVGFQVSKIATKHLVQAVIAGSLFLFGFLWTLNLSQKTYFSAKANAQQNKVQQEAKQEAMATNLLKERQTKLEEIERLAMREEQALEKHYNALIVAEQAKYEAKKKQKEAYFDEGRLSKTNLAKYMAKYDEYSNAATKRLLNEKFKKLAPIQRQAKEELQETKATYNTYEKSLAYKASSARSALASEIEANAQETQGRNVLYNVVNVLLMLGLLFFAKYSLEEQQPTPKNNTGTQTHQHRHTIKEETAHQRMDTDTQNKKSSVITDEHTDTQTHKTTKEDQHTSSNTEYIDYEVLEEKQVPKPTFFEKEGYQLKKEKGVISILHNKKYVTLGILNTWIKTYQDRVDKYVKEGKVKLATKNSNTMAILSQKANFLKTQGYLYANVS